ncbi:alpha/beta-hydrolase [Trichodelitschia bisporula]|uniref:Alpha/beta-hydrolase n=1 Tax=Trichodelitschia bisporula TaxID=703511 RepID=A0A6G1HXB0_9PEZI|nr:alpha/beta-hydrolase [Trichodelitschia bisporula]
MSVTIRKAYVDTPHGQLHYRYAAPVLAADAKPKETLLFLHKSASSSVSYELLMGMYAAKGHPCYAPDYPGFGRSFDPDAEAIALIEKDGTAWFAKLVLNAVRSLGVQTAHIIGHHSGTALALELAATVPEFTKSIALVGPAVMSEEERAAMKEVYFAPFNEPRPDGGHLLKTWEYLAHMGVGEDIGMWQREALDHLRAWRGRTLIYGAVWAQECEALYMKIECPILLMCARDDVLWKYFGHVKSLRPEIPAVEVGGANFELDRDAGGIEKAWTSFMETLSGV